jgi:hypothetical protein
MGRAGVGLRQRGARQRQLVGTARHPRAPGTGLPKVIALGGPPGSRIHDFAAVYGRRPALVVEMNRRVISTALSSPASMRPSRLPARQTSAEPPGLAHASH